MSDARPNASAFYDHVWDTWSALDAKSPAAFHRRRLVLELIGRHAKGARSVLELGCGRGALLAELERALPEAFIHGADVSAVSLARARDVCTRSELFTLDLEDARFDAAHAARFASFDLIVMSEVLEHLPNEGRALERVRSLLGPEGRLIVSVPGGKRTRFDVAIGHLRHYSLDTLSQALADAGFELESAMAWGFPFHNLYRALVRIAAEVSLNEGAQQGRPSALASAGYAALASVLMPLYYLNRPRFGPQLFAVATLRAKPQLGVGRAATTI